MRIFKAEDVIKWSKEHKPQAYREYLASSLNAAPMVAEMQREPP